MTEGQMSKKEYEKRQQITYTPQKKTSILEKLFPFYIIFVLGVIVGIIIITISEDKFYKENYDKFVQYIKCNSDIYNMTDIISFEDEYNKWYFNKAYPEIIIDEDYNLINIMEENNNE